LSAQSEEPASELNMEELRRRILGEAPNELMNYSLGDTNVSLFVTGSWKGELQGNLGFFVSPVGTGFISPETPLLFKQEVDLSLSLWIDDRWFVEANFLDNSAQNTYRAGYQGKPGEFLQYAGVGNTGLDFPSFPYLDLGGDSPSSFGFYSRFENNNFNIHALVRYDAASREERVFYGNRERTFGDVSLQNSIQGVSFVLPNENINSEIIVYIEDERGSLIDTYGRRWRVASHSEYAASSLDGLLELSLRTDKMIAIAYSDGIRPWTGTIGSFFSAVQAWFGLNLDKYPKFWDDSNFSIDNRYALIIYQPGTFSPFQRLSRYDAPSSASERAAFVRISTGTEISGFELIQYENIGSNFGSASASQRAVYELIRAGGANARLPESRFPLAKEFPEAYLPPFGAFPGDAIIRFTNFNSTNGFFIGQDVIPGSIQVWRSGIQDANFSYNQSSGEVSLNSSTQQNEIIRITYLKQSEGARVGSIAAGIGAVYKRASSPFSAQAAVGIRWNLTDDSFTEANQTSAGTVGISAKTAWDFDNLKAQITGGFTFVQTDSTGLYRIAGFEGHETILYLSLDTSFASNQTIGFNLSDRENLIYRNYYSNNVLGSTLMNIDWNAPEISGIARPYPAKDRHLGDTQVLAAEFRNLGSGKWTGFQVPLGANSEILSRASEIEIPFRFYDFKGDTGNIRVIIQIGKLSSRDFPFDEDPQLIWQNVLYTGPWTTDESARLIRIQLNDSDRVKLSEAKYLRLIIANDTASTVTGRVLLAPPFVRGSAFRPVEENNNIINPITSKVNAIETRETDANRIESRYPDYIRRLHPNNETNMVLKIDWEGLTGNNSAGADGRLARIPLADYREISFFVKGSPTLTPAGNGFLHFIIASGPDSISNPQLKASIPLEAFAQDQWRKVTIRYSGNNTGFRVDGSNITGSVYYRPERVSLGDPSLTSYAAILVDPGDYSNLHDKGSLYIDEIILEDSVMVYRMNAGTAVEYTRPGTLISIGNIPILEDFTITAAAESEAHTESDLENADFNGSAGARTGLSVSVLGAKVAGNFSFTAAEDSFLWSADHSIARSFGNFSIRETFFASPYSGSARHTLNLSYVSDFFARFEADAVYDLARLRQRWGLNTGFTPKNNLIPSISIFTDASWTKHDKIEEHENYGELWLKTFIPLIPDDGSGADSRRMQTQIILTQRTRPVGAVLTLMGNTSFTAVNSLTRTENSIFLDIPVIFDRLSFNFRAGRGFRKHVTNFGSNIIDDNNVFFSNISDSLHLFGFFPIYSLFTPDLESVMDSVLNNSLYVSVSQYTAFNDQFNVRINLPQMHDLKAFYIPSRINLRLERVLEQKLETKTDILNIGGSLGFSAINMFGAMGNTPIFKFYQTDEFTHGIETSFFIPKDDSVTWRVQSVINAGFRGFSGGVLKFTNTFTARSGGHWIESFSAAWETPVEKSILSGIYDWVASSVENQEGWLSLSALLNSNYEKLRRETLEIIFDKSQDNLRWSIIACHEEIVRILGRLNFTAFIKLRFTENLTTEIFTFDAAIGTTLRISF